MFKELRQARKALSQEQVIEVLEKSSYCVVATNCEDGYPYAAPVHFIYMDGAIYAHGAMIGQKIDNIRRDPRVCFTTFTDTVNYPDLFDTDYKSVVIFGKAHEVSGEEKRNALVGFLNKYSADYMDSGKEYIERAFNGVSVWKIDIEHITGKGQHR